MSKPINWASNKPQINSTEPTDLIAGKFGKNQTSGYIKVEDLRGYKVYSCLLTQTGSNAPEEQTLINELELGTINWARTSAGLYVGTLTGLYVNPDKVLVLAGSPDFGSTAGIVINYNQEDVNSFTLVTASPADFAYVDDKLDNTLFEIRVYP